MGLLKSAMATIMGHHVHEAFTKEDTLRNGGKIFRTVDISLHIFGGS
jgi:hypothetical protein